MAAIVKVYDLYWSPEGRKIATVEAKTMKAAKRKAPYPYRKYLGEIYAVEVGVKNTSIRKRFKGKKLPFFKGHFKSVGRATRRRKKDKKAGLIPINGIKVSGRTVTFRAANPGVLKRYKKKLTALAKRLVK